MILQEPIKPFSFVAFGAGPRLCLGMNLAKLEISLFVHFLVTKYR
jgi:cytochrome P450